MGKATTGQRRSSRRDRLHAHQTISDHSRNSSVDTAGFMKELEDPEGGAGASTVNPEEVPERMIANNGSTFIGKIIF